MPKFLFFLPAHSGLRCFPANLVSIKDSLIFVITAVLLFNCPSLASTSTGEFDISPAEFQHLFNIHAKEHDLPVSSHAGIKAVAHRYKFEIAPGLVINGVFSKSNGNITDIELESHGDRENYASFLAASKCLIETVDPSLDEKHQAGLLKQLGIELDMIEDLSKTQTERNGYTYRVWTSQSERGKSLHLQVFTKVQAEDLINDGARKHTSKSSHSFQPGTRGRHTSSRNSGIAQVDNLLSRAGSIPGVPGLGRISRVPYAGSAWNSASRINRKHQSGAIQNAGGNPPINTNSDTVKSRIPGEPRRNAELTVPEGMQPIPAPVEISAQRWKEIQQRTILSLQQLNYRPKAGDICFVGESDVGWLTDAALQKWFELRNKESARVHQRGKVSDEFVNSAVATSNGELIKLDAGIKVKILEGHCEGKKLGFSGTGRIEILTGPQAGKICYHHGYFLQNHYSDHPDTFLRSETEKQIWMDLLSSRLNGPPVSSEEVRQGRLFEPVNLHEPSYDNPAATFPIPSDTNSGNLAQDFHNHLMRLSFAELVQAEIDASFAYNQNGEKSEIDGVLGMRLSSTSTAELLRITDQLVPGNGVYAMLYQELLGTTRKARSRSD